MNFSGIMPIIICLTCGYLLGSIPSGYLAGKWISGIDLRECGSGSTGATNVLRYVGKKPALGVFIVDVLKGIAAIALSRHFQLEGFWQVFAGVAALLGHIWPVWLRWKGGKAVATGLGIFLGLSWQVGLASLGVFMTILSTTRIVSLSSVFAATSLPLFMFLSFKEGSFSLSYFVISVIAMFLVLWRHRTNISRLLRGKEPRIGQKD